jgi:hypothetical protein
MDVKSGEQRQIFSSALCMLQRAICNKLPDVVRVSLNITPSLIRPSSERARWYSLCFWRCDAAKKTRPSFTEDQVELNASQHLYWTGWLAL